MLYIIITIVATVAAAAFCAVPETAIRDASESEIESLKTKSPALGKFAENFRQNTLPPREVLYCARILCAAFAACLSGIFFFDLFSDKGVIPAVAFSAVCAAAFFAFACALPQRLLSLCRPKLSAVLVRTAILLEKLAKPFAKIADSNFGKDATDDEDIIMLAEKGRKDGSILQQERDLIANALSLDDVEVSEIMTPRTVVAALDKDKTVAQVFAETPNLNFSRIPVYAGTIDNVVGIVRRRDILTAVAGDRHNAKISGFMRPPIFVPETATALSVLRQLIKRHQQMAVVVDEFASLTGVVTLEDIFEHLLGSEIFETDDIAVDMREFARRKKSKTKANL